MEIIISGKAKAHGLAIRAMKEAHQHQITGSARYINDDKMIIYAEGKEDQLDSFLSWCGRLKLEEEIRELCIRDSLTRKYTEFDIYLK